MKEVIILERLDLMFKKLETRKKYHCITYWDGDVMVGRKCTVCGEDKLIEEFNFSNKEKGTRKGCCKKCESEKYKEYKNNNPEKEKERIKNGKKITLKK